MFDRRVLGAGDSIYLKIFILNYKHQNLFKMKKVILFLAVSALLFSSCDANDSYKCKQSVEKSFPNALSIVQPTNEEFSWIVMDKDSSIYYVETMNLLDTEISQKELIFK